MPHALVIGGTGMLRGASLELARRGHDVSVVARSHARLSELAHAGASTRGRIHPTPADYTDTQPFAAALRTAMIARGPFDLAVCWVHSTAPQAVGLIARFMERESSATPRRLVHILGCEADHPEDAMRTRPMIAPTPGVQVTRVVLGFVVEGQASRWLTHEEICAGVIEAIDAVPETHTIGQTRPWSMRP
ncbi:MAG TPA: hypothetical protein PKE29_04670 [Phycisphaerales bacterium]|nr:hypothetical protein [Phycisphaerales bacterium]